jgi:hypothetical protein
MAANVDDIIEAAASGVLRALEAREAGQAARSKARDATVLVKSGFFVDVHVRVGGFPPGPPWDPGPLGPGTIETESERRPLPTRDKAAE